MKTTRKQLLINIAKRLVCKAIKVNTEEYKIEVAYKFIISHSAINITLFKNNSKCKSYLFYDDEWDFKNYMFRYKAILRKIRKREL